LGLAERCFSEVTLELLYSEPEERKAGLHLWPDGRVEYYEPGGSVPYHTHAPTFVTVRSATPQEQRELPTLELLAWQLMTSLGVVRNLLPLVGAHGKGSVKRLWLDLAGEEPTVQGDLEGTAPGLPYASLSGGEHARMLMELAIEKAHFAAQRTPTVLVLDAEVSRLDSRWLSRYADYFTSADGLYQTDLTP
jgi:hypothetical protein